MIRLLSMEWMKFRRNRLFYVLLLFYSLSLAYFSNKILNLSLGNAQINQFLPDFKTGVELWGTVGSVANYGLYFFFSFWIIYMLRIEFQYKTFRQGVLSGLTRYEFYVLKVLHIFSMAIVFSIIYSLISLILGLTSGNSFSSLIATAPEYILRHFTLAMFYGLLAAILSVLFNRNGIAYILFLIYFLIERMILGLLDKLSSLDISSASFWPHKMADQLLPNLITKYGSEFSKLLSQGVMDTFYVIMVSALIIAAMMLLFYYTIRQKNL